MPSYKPAVLMLTWQSHSFPSVWHTLKDDASALDLETIRVWTRILRVLTAEYLALDSDDGLYKRENAKTELVRRRVPFSVL